MAIVQIYDRKTTELGSARYVALFISEPQADGKFKALKMDEAPFSHWGVRQEFTALPTELSGERVKLDELPSDCQLLVRQYTDSFEFRV